jgi:AcrR family transcriptional regulator
MQRVRSKGLKRTQRERLVQGMVEAANSGGYASANVSTVIANAGVSRPTFYDYFSDRDDCFAAAVRDVQDELVERVEQTIAARESSQAIGAAIEALVTFAGSQPARARFGISEALAGGRSAREARDHGIQRIAELIESSLLDAPESGSAPDVEHRVVLGGVYRLIATRLRRGEPAISRLIDELEQWLGSYQRRLAEHRWRALAPAPRSAPSPHLPLEPIQRMANALPSGRPRASDEELAATQRLRILYATARMAEQKGYIGTTVADIVKLARVDRHVFYKLFSDKQDAFLAAHELGFSQVMDLTSKAFFAGENWPNRSWEGGRALTQLLEDNPLVAQIGFVEAYAVGPAAIQRIEESHIAFAFFLQEGLVYREQERPPSRVAMEAIIASIFEIVYLQARDHGTPEVAAMLPHIAHLWLTPFLGAGESDEFIDEQLSRESALERRLPVD